MTDYRTTYDFTNLDTLGNLTVLPQGTNGTYGTSGKYVTFGIWPQTIAPSRLSIRETPQGYKWDEYGYYCIKLDKAKSLGDEYNTIFRFTNLEPVVTGKSYYFRIEPIKWRVLTENYVDAAGNSKALLVAESVIINKPFYGTEANRTISEKTIYPNNYKYSNIRAYLNGIKNAAIEDGLPENKYNIDWTGKGFLQKAFTPEQRKLIHKTAVDNSLSTTAYTNYNNQSFASPKYICENTEDYVFLLAESDTNKSEYGFKEHWIGSANSTRVRIASDYMRAQGAKTGTSGEWFGNSLWRTRSPCQKWSTGEDIPNAYKRNWSVSDAGSSGTAIECYRIDVGYAPAICIDKSLLH